jgi:hypothetical protein
LEDEIMITIPEAVGLIVLFVVLAVIGFYVWGLCAAAAMEAPGPGDEQ